MCPGHWSDWGQPCRSAANAGEDGPCACTWVEHLRSIFFSLNAEMCRLDPKSHPRQAASLCRSRLSKSNSWALLSFLHRGR